jgi:hypothetical protein
MGSTLSAEEQAEFDQLAQTEDWLRGNERWFKRNREFARQCASSNREKRAYMLGVLEADRRRDLPLEQWTDADHALQRQWEIDERAREAEGVRRARELAAQLNVGRCDRCGAHDARSLENLCPECLAERFKGKAADRTRAIQRVVRTVVVLVALLAALAVAWWFGVFGG